MQIRRSTQLRPRISLFRCQCNDGIGNHKCIANNGSSIVLYMTDDGNTQLEVKLEKDTVWLTQSQMAELFGRDRTVVGRHIAKVYQEGELSREATCAFFAQVTPHGAMPGKTHTQQVPFYNLDMVISVGYRVNSKNATRFRQWATSILKLSVRYLVHQ